MIKKILILINLISTFTFCGKTKSTIKNKGTTQEVSFKEFDVSFHNFGKNFDYKTEAKNFYNWFIDNAFYGNEIYGLNKFSFHKTTEEETLSKDLVFHYNAENAEVVIPITIYNNSNDFKNKIMSKAWGRKIRHDSWENEIYGILHEYFHYKSFFYGSDNFPSGKLKLNFISNKYFALHGLDKKEEFNKPSKIKEIPDTEFIFKGPDGKSYPTYYVKTSQKESKYLWTHDELYVRTLLNYHFRKSYPYFDKLTQEDKVLFPEFYQDQIFLAIVGSNPYATQNYENWFKQYRKFMINDWFNQDELLSNAIVSRNGDLYIQTNKKVNINLIGKEENVPGISVESKENIFHLSNPIYYQKNKLVKFGNKTYLYRFPKEMLNSKTYTIKVDDKEMETGFQLSERNSFTKGYKYSQYKYKFNIKNNKITITL